MYRLSAVADVCLKLNWPEGISSVSARPEDSF